MSAQQAPYRLRGGRPRDLDALCALETSAFRGDRIARRSFRRFLTSLGADLIVAELADGVAGYALGLFRRGSKVARLYSIAVAPAASGRGIGAALLAAAEQAAGRRGCTAMRLEVAARNKRAARLYSLAGYRQFGRIDGYYEDGGAALRFEKAL